jgi:coproporphyrinogen III oxidase
MGEMDAGQLEARKARAKQWFESLRDDICAAFEALEAVVTHRSYRRGRGRRRHVDAQGEAV